LNQRYLPSPEEAERLSTGQLRAHFLAEGLFAPGEVRMILTDVDRMLLGGAVPRTDLRLPDCPELGSRHFTDRREIGVINIGEAGNVRVGDESFSLDHLDCLYIGIGGHEIVFSPGAGQPVFYFLSSPARARFPTAKLARGEGHSASIGDAEHASRRRITRCIHPDGIPSCQLVMGYTELESGSVWNTMPAHTHARRAEAYLYFGLGDEIAVHLMGRPGATRSLIVRDREAVISPSWSIHCAAATRNYTFVWAMTGENQSFEDMDPVRFSELR
jgi:4-deoxy-L-threo-5-hexosulose-uronate ketol-isomerase